MPLYRPSELTAFLRSLDIRPKRSMSQNFLIDGNIVQKIVESVPEGANVVEIGPGPGVLTESLLAHGFEILAIEKDDTLAAALPRLDETGHRLKVVHQDVLEYSLSEKSTIVANLPYSLTTPIFKWIIKQHVFVSRAIVMVQHEVAERLLHPPTSYLQVLLSCAFDLYYLCRVSKKCFLPVPKVDSAVLVLLHKQKAVKIPQEVLAYVFSQKRKTLLSSLSKFYPKEKIEERFDRLGLSNKLRPEQLSPDLLLELLML